MQGVVPEGEADFLGEFVFGVEFGLIFVRDAQSEGSPSSVEWDPILEPVLAWPRGRLIAVRHYVDGPTRCQVWSSGNRADQLPHVLHTGSMSVPSGLVLIGDVNEDILLKIRPDGSEVGVTVRADSSPHGGHIQVELSGV